MDYTIKWIGTGSALNPALGNTSFTVNGEGERRLLVDCGSTVPLALIKEGILKDITDVLVTHAHADHIGGLEALGFMNYFGYKNRDDKRPSLYVGSDELAQALWNYSLKGGMEKIQDDNNYPMRANLETYFKIHSGKEIIIPGLPKINLHETLHVHGMENYGLNIEGGIFYSGDTVLLPPSRPKVIFQDCQFFETPSDVHISYQKLKKEVSREVKRKMYLVHLGNGYDKNDCRADGFVGFVLPGDTFNFTS